MHRILLSLLMLALCVSLADSAERKFPYEAMVDVEKEYARSGNGRNYYPTSELKRGTHVTVRRHDLGGWVMIDPPPGSFSWIKADHVRPSKENQGTVIENNVIVRIGSSFNDDHDWYQRELSKGDPVEILGEKTFETDRGSVKMLKIKPPANEYRWIMGKALRPIDAPARKPFHEGDVAEKPQGKKNDPEMLVGDDDPFSNDTTAQTKPQDDVRDSLSQGQWTADADALDSTTPAVKELDELHTQLTSADEKFRTMIKQEPPNWDLASLEQEYRQLEASAQTPAMQTQLKQRLDAVNRYTKIKQEYVDFMRLSSETKQRDAQLMSLSNQPPNSTDGLPSFKTEVPNTNKSIPNLNSAPANSTPGAATAVPTVPLKYDGAGIVQRTFSMMPNAPRYVLVSPNGRLLSYLHPAPGVDLSPYVGQAMGITGQRSFRQELRGDLIVVRGLQPVRLQPVP